MLASLPAWGERVEILSLCSNVQEKGHSPHGECGLKYEDFDLPARRVGHSPHGECGLKSVRPTPDGERGVTPRMGSAG